MSVGIFGVEFEGCVVAVDRLIVSAETIECRTEVTMSQFIFGVDFYGSAVALRRLFVSVGIEMVVSLIQILLCRFLSCFCRKQMRTQPLFLGTYFLLFIGFMVFLSF